MKLNTEALTLFKGNVAKLTASVEPFGVQPDTVTWSSDNTDVATVSDNGLVTAVDKGTANITATSVEGSLRQRHLRGHCQGGGGHPERRSAGCQGQGSELFTWDLANDATWTAGSELEAGSVSATTLDDDNNTLLLLDGDSYNMHEVRIWPPARTCTLGMVSTAATAAISPCSISLTATCTPVNRTAPTWFGCVRLLCVHSAASR